MTSLIDIVIPVHTPDRPIARAVSSVVRSSADTRAIVVCHNLPESDIAGALGDLATHPRVRLEGLVDGIPSPAGPLNRGMQTTTAEYIGFLGSDDEFEDGALACWSRELQGRPDLLIGRLSSETGGEIVAPAPRAGRSERLDPVRDLLNTRTAPVGVMIRRTLVQGAGCPGFTEGLRTGEDIALGLYLWNAAERIDASRCSAGYLIREDGTDRVTSQQLRADSVVPPIRHAVSVPALRRLSLRRRRAIAVKLMRFQMLTWYAPATLDASDLLEPDGLESAAAALRDLDTFAPGARGYLNAAENVCLDAVASGDPSRITAAALKYRSAPRLRRLLTRNPLRVCAPESPLGGLLRSRARARYRQPPQQHAQPDHGKPENAS